MRASTERSHFTGLSTLDQLMLCETYLSDRGPNIIPHHANLSTGHLQSDKFVIAGQDNSASARFSCYSSTFARIEGNVVDHGADRDLVERQSVSHEDWCIFCGNDLLSNEETGGIENVAFLTVLIMHQANACRAERIVFNGFDGSKHITLIACKVDDTIVLPLIAILLARLSANTGGHLNWLALRLAECLFEFVYQWFVTSVASALLVCGDTAVTQSIVHRLANADA
mmetsp:Transcript_22196/g.39986  ORF Transcript_22196/g.39986 Transcript_22196/m.39986 type:complete len:227 (+) Transcript_22196:258-938(+)